METLNKISKQLKAEFEKKVIETFKGGCEIRNLSEVYIEDLRNNITILSVEVEKIGLAIEWDNKNQISVIKTTWSNQEINDKFMATLKKIKTLKKFWELNIFPNLKNWE